VNLLKLVTSHSIKIQELDCVPLMVNNLGLWILALYGDEMAKPNTHWATHLEFFMYLYGICRGTWTFPQESILALAKKATKKMTNHRAVSFSCVRLFILQRILEGMLFPSKSLPIR